jgi:hypothetical protein
MYKIFLFVIIAFTASCQSKDKAEKTLEEQKLEQAKDAQAPKPKPALLTANYPATVLNESLIKRPEKVGTAKKWIIVAGTRVGDVTKTTTLAELKSSYGAENITDGVFEQGKKKFLTSIVFENKPNEFEVFWGDTLTRKNPKMVKIRGTNGDWLTTQGIRVGATVEELVAINRKDFYFIGFDNMQYDGLYNGKLRSWDDGEVSKYIGITLMYDNIANAKESFSRFQHLESFPSNYPDVKDLGLTVKEVSCTFN